MKHFVVAMCLVALATVRPTAETPRVIRVETRNAANQWAPVSTPYVAPGHEKEYVIYGPWVDYADKVTFANVAQVIVEKKALLTSDAGVLRVRLTAPASAPRGVRELTIHITCPAIPFTDCVTGNLTQKVMVLRVGTVTRIEPAIGVVAGAPTEFVVFGTGLDVAALHPKVPAVAPRSVRRTESTFRFTATMPCGTSAILLRDEAEGGDVYPYVGNPTVASKGNCGG